MPILPSITAFRSESAFVYHLIIFLQIVALFCPALFAADLIKTDRIVVEYDDLMHRRLEWLGCEGNSIMENTSSVQAGVVISGRSISDFTVQTVLRRQIHHAEFGMIEQGIITGEYRDEKVHIGRETRILCPDGFPDVVLFQTTFRNFADTPVHIDRIYADRLLLNRRSAEPAVEPWEFASFQGGVYVWGKDYALIRLKPGFFQSNFQGIHGVDGDRYRVGGGIPFIDVWGKTMGVAVAHLEKQPEWLSLPVSVRQDGLVEMALVEEPDEDLGQRVWLSPGDSCETVLSAVIFHRLDFHDPLRLYSELLRCRGIAIKRTSPVSAYQPYWKSWGAGNDFSTDWFLGLLPELCGMGIAMANLDAGWFNLAGDWQVDRSPAKFPGGEKDIIEFVRQVKRNGFRIGVWWHPLAVDPASDLAKKRPDLLVQAKDGSFPVEEMGCYQLCPAYQPTLDYVEKLLERFIHRWDFDGVYSDKIGLAAVPPCYNKAHNHESPLESFRSVSELFRVIEESLHRYKKDPYSEVCICATPHSPYNMPYYDIATASDPVTPLQMRRRIKVEKAIHGPSFAVGDCYQVPVDEWRGSSVPQSFESAMGTGAQLTTFYKDLDSGQLKIWQKWFRKYRELGLSSGEYLNYYDIAFDTPEGHVVRKGGDLYYGFFADHWPKGDRIELRGLNRERLYEVYDYARDRHLGKLDGSDPFLNTGFKESLLLRLRPIGTVE